MRYVEIGGRQVSAIGLGTWQFGSREWGYGPDYASREAAEILHRALELGVNLVDTAEAYGFGASERIIGAATKGMRDQVFLATKLLPIMPVGPIVKDRARRSARRLGVETIDLYQVHWPNPVVPIGVQMQPLRDLVDEGVIANVGVSNFSLGKWEAAELALGRPVVSNQVLYNLAHRAPEGGITQYAASSSHVVIAYSPLAQGLLSGKYGPERRPGGMRGATVNFLAENLDRSVEMIDALRSVAKAHDATPSQVALAWLLHRPNVVVIPGAASVAQLETNVAAVDIELSKDEDARLTEASDAYRPAAGPRAWLSIGRDRIRSRFSRS